MKVVDGWDADLRMLWTEKGADGRQTREDKATSIFRPVVSEEDVYERNAKQAHEHYKQESEAFFGQIAVGNPRKKKKKKKRRTRTFKNLRREPDQSLRSCEGTQCKAKETEDSQISAIGCEGTQGKAKDTPAGQRNISDGSFNQC